jgi:hypothetical protein
VDSCGSELGPVMGYCVHGNEFLDSIKGRHFFHYLRTFSLSGRSSPHGVLFVSFEGSPWKV